MKKYLPLIFILLFSWILQFQLYSEQVLLTDDLARIRESRYYTSFSSFIINFLNTNTMSSRPISGIFYAPSIYLTRYLGMEIYYINYLFYLSSLVMIYIVISKFYDNKVATLGTFIYSILPIGTSIVFSPIMMNSALATIFYCISLLFILKIKENSLIVERERERERERKIYVLLSIISLFLSVLSYEIFIPLILLNAYLLPTNKISYKLLYLIITLGLIFGYRQILEPLLFSNYFHRNNNVNILNLSRNIKIIKEIALIFSIRLPNAIFRGIKAIIFYEIKDYILLLIGSFFSYFIIFKQNYSYSNKKSISFILFISFISTFGIFFLSSYTPNIWDFDNRNLGGVRLFLIFSILYLFLSFYNSFPRITKIGGFILLISLNITTISIKNAWIYANDFNIQLFQELKQHLPKSPKTNNFYIVYDKTQPDDRRQFQRNNPHFILSEPIFQTYWDAPTLRDRVGIPKHYQIEYLHYRSSKLPETYYIYDYKTKTMEYIEENP